MKDGVLLQVVNATRLGNGWCYELADRNFVAKCNVFGTEDEAECMVKEIQHLPQMVALLKKLNDVTNHISTCQCQENKTLEGLAWKAQTILRSIGEVER